jgi:hypothetical protein
MEQQAQIIADNFVLQTLGMKSGVTLKIKDIPILRSMGILLSR